MSAMTTAAMGLAMGLFLVVPPVAGLTTRVGLAATIVDETSRVSSTQQLPLSVTLPMEPLPTKKSDDGLGETAERARRRGAAAADALSAEQTSPLAFDSFAPLAFEPLLSSLRPLLHLRQSLSAVLPSPDGAAARSAIDALLEVLGSGRQRAVRGPRATDADAAATSGGSETEPERGRVPHEGKRWVPERTLPRFQSPILSQPTETRW